MITIELLQSEIEKIKERNSRVEADKAWETSFPRKIIIAALTYFVVVIFFYFSGFPRPFANAIVPSIAFIVSTLSISVFKQMWIKNNYKK